MDMQPKSIRT